MTTPIDNAVRPARQPVPYVMLGLSVVVMLTFYLRYASHAWFFQDDFGLMAQYRTTLHLDQLWNFNDFGRFISRNLYWNLGLAVFGNHAIAFFLANLGSMLGCSALIFSTFRGRIGTTNSVVASLIYFCLPAVALCFVWIANSQHLLGHLFVLLFIWLYQKNDQARISAARTAALTMVLLVGLLANVFVGFVIALPIWYMIFNAQRRHDKMHWLLAALGTLSFVYLVHSLKRFQTGAYAVNVSLDTLIVTARFYFHALWLCALWALACVAGALFHLKRHRPFESWLFVASLLFFSPFAFLEFQRYEQYGAMAQLFFLLGIWSTLCFAMPAQQKRQSLRIGAVLIAFLVWSCLPSIRYFLHDPWGAGTKRVVAQLADFDRAHPGVRHYCFSAVATSADTTAHAGELPLAWWHVAFGTAFKQLVSPDKTYQLVPDATNCEVTFGLEDDRLVERSAAPR